MRWSWKAVTDVVIAVLAGFVCLLWAENPVCAAEDPLLLDTGLPQAGPLFDMDAVPSAEPVSEIREREAYLETYWQDHRTVVSNQLQAGTFDSYLTNVLAATTGKGLDEEIYTHFTQMDLLYGFSGMTGILTNRMTAAGLADYQAALDALAASATGQLNDLDTVEPAIYMLELACQLKLLGAYNGVFKQNVESFIGTYVEGKSYYTGSYLTTGYNKEVYAMRVASLVYLLYGENTNTYPVTKATFDVFWNGVMYKSYDADNSPHYDAGTGFQQLLIMGLAMGRTNDLKNSIHMTRIMDRMARTVCSSGQAAKWGKSMEGLVGLGTLNELQLDAGAVLSWDLLLGYQLYGDPFYLYVARKYADLYLRDATERLSNTPLPFLWVWPAGINSFGTSAAPSAADLTSLSTPRITSRTAYSGLLLGRGDTNYVTVQDKLILSTGHNPKSPYMLMDLSYTQSKAAYDHRIGIDVLMYQGTHLATRYGRRSSANLINGIFAGPSQIDFPIVPTVSSDVTPPSDGSDAYSQYVGYNAAFDYHIRSREAASITNGAAYSSVDYAQFAYPGVEAKRQCVLLNNGVLVVLDRIKAVSGYQGGRSVGTLYQILDRITQRGSRWVLQSAHRATLPGPASVVRPDIQTLFYFPPMGNYQVKLANNPYDESSSVQDVFCAWKALNSGETIEIVSLIMPVAEPRWVPELIDQIRVDGGQGRYTVRLPHRANSSLQVDFYPDHPATFTLESSLAETSFAPLYEGPVIWSNASGASVSIPLSFCSYSTNALLYSATGLPSGVTLDTVQGILRGTVATTGAYTVAVSASDGLHAGSGTLRWFVGVRVAASTNTVTLVQSGKEACSAGDPPSISVLFSGPTNAVPTFSATGLPSGVQIDTRSGLIYGNTTNAGLSHVTVTATSSAGTARTSFDLYIREHAATENGTPYVWLDTYFTNLVTDADCETMDNSDADGDRLASWKEYVAGTDPADADSVFAFSSIEPVDGSFVVRWYSVQGKSYSLLTNSNLVLPAWGVAASNLTGQSGQTSCTVDVNSASTFFKVDVK